MTGRPEREVVEGGPSRAPLTDRVPQVWRRRGVVLLALVLGALAGAGAARWWDDRSPGEGPEPSREAAAGSQVRLVLHGVVPPAPQGPTDGVRRNAALWLDAVLLHGRGPGTATVTRIHRPGGSVAIVVPDLPVRLSVNHSFQRVRLRLRPRDCRLATEWTPSAQPFVLTWRDAEGVVHGELGGDHDAALELALIDHLNAVCGPRTQH